MKVLSVVSIDLSVSSEAVLALNLTIPSNEIIRINSVACMPVVQSTGTAAPLSLMAGLSFKDLALGSLTPADVAAHSGILFYGNLDATVDTVTENGQYQPRVELDQQNSYAFDPVLMVGNNGAVAGAGTVDVLFDVDYDFVKVTQKIAVEISGYI